MKQKIGIIGKGNVGKALQAGVQRAGYETRMIGKSGGVKDTAAWADVVILAVPFGALDAVAAEIGTVANGKPVVDATNALTKEGGLAVGFTTSGAEQLQKKMPGAHVVKAFNTIFAQNMSSGKLKQGAGSRDRILPGAVRSPWRRACPPTPPTPISCAPPPPHRCSSR